MPGDLWGKSAQQLVELSERYPEPLGREHVGVRVGVGL